MTPETYRLLFGIALDEEYRTLLSTGSKVKPANISWRDKAILFAGYRLLREGIE